MIHNQEVLERLERLEYLLGLKSGGSVGPIFAEPFTYVSASATVGRNASKIAVTASAGTVTLTLPALSTLPANWLLIVTAQGCTQPIVIAPPTGTIWDPSTSAYAATATLTNGAGGSVGWWQFDPTVTKFNEIV